MQLSKRLKAIAESIPVHRRIIDIGCDHALLDIYLVQTREDIRAIASDISAPSIQKAKQTAVTYGVQDRIDFYVTDGLRGIPVKKEDIIVITGMGAYTMLSILEALHQKNTLVLSAHKDTALLRRTLCKQGYYIKEEKLVLEKHWYFILTFEKGYKKYDEVDYEIGPSARYHKNYINFLYQKELQISKQKKEKTKRLSLLETKVLPFLKKDTL